MKSVMLDGRRVVIAGFVSSGEVESARKAIKSSWPCCARSIRQDKLQTAVRITTPTVSLAQEIFGSMRQLFHRISPT